MTAMSPRREKRHERNGNLPLEFTQRQADKGVTVRGSDDYRLMVTAEELARKGGYLTRGWDGDRKTSTPNRLYILKRGKTEGTFRLKRVFKTKDGKPNRKYADAIKAIRALEVKATEARKKSK